ncbi:ectoine hydroxylase [Ammoniphilus resinae]|uniref:Ectoine hydroxylase n=1 Tax=Ammoniphilus resinae TaxID=861532 RepID=A0ABS4GQC2_9BACL|nr:ectoine hydroxylase [Ammoniphilus resinae]MBP1932065.1 ectoine hydroxylase [Ammoniphilus resinae]
MNVKVEKDLYLSRESGHSEIVPRLDPVVYLDQAAGLADGPLDSGQLGFYEGNGYLHMEGFFSEEEVQGLRDELNRLWAVNQDSAADEVIREPQSQEIRSIFAIHESSKVFGELSQHPRIQGIVRQILGSEVYVHQSRINYKKGFTGKEFYWHSDFETWHVEDGMPRMRALSCSISLEDNYEFNGPLMVIPGSHRDFISCVGRTPENHYKESLRKQEYGVPDQESLTSLVQKYGIKSCTGRAGSVTFFDCNIMHGSNGNITPLPRSNVFLVFNSVENRLVEPYSGQKPRPGYIAKR